MRKIYKILSRMNIIWLIIFLLPSCKKESKPAIEGGNAKTGTSLTVSLVSNGAIKPAAFFDANLTVDQNLSAYHQINGDPFTAMVINPSRISVVNDPVYGSKRKVMFMNVRPQDTGGLTDNPRAQVQTPMNYVEGQTVYVGLSVRFTQTLWTYFLTFSEFYGAPYSGTSPFRLAIQGSNIVASATNNGKQTNLWQVGMNANVWYDFVYCEVLSNDPTKGQVQVWLRKEGETAYNQVVPPTRLATITSANITGPNYHKLACYYDKNNTFTDAGKKTHVSAVEMYLGNHKVGSSFNMVAPVLVN